MTRETKVGLLVGLAFIIVIGILLSDYNRLESQPAPLTAVADTLRTGAATPHNGSVQIAVVPPPAAASPSHPVLTRDELREETRIDIGPAKGMPGGLLRQPGVRAVQPTGPSDTAADRREAPAAPKAETDLGTYAREHGAEIQPVEHSAAPRPEAPTVNGARQYVAVAGDTVNKLAGRFLGANTRPNREAILALNPSLKQNPNNVIVGHTYVIPAKTAAGPLAPPVRVAANPPAPAESGPMAWYTVKDNDSLWKIAAEQLGDGSAWIAIRDMNKELLKGGDSVRKGIRLRLPPRSVATTN